MPSKKTKTETQTATTSHTKLLVATLALFVAGGLAFASLPFSPKNSDTLKLSYPKSNQCNVVKVIPQGKKQGKDGELYYTSVTIKCSQGKEQTVDTETPQTAESLAVFAKTFCAKQCSKQKTQKEKSESEGITCSESDSGRDYETPGYITTGGRTIADRCISDSLIEEQYCRNNRGDQHRKNCPCAENDEGYAYCLDEEEPEETPSCIDTDGGRNITQRGEVTWTDYEGTVHTITDRCYSGSIVEEAICEGPTRMRIRCADGMGCYDGTCVSHEEIVERENQEHEFVESPSTTPSSTEANTSPSSSPSST